MNFIGCDWGTTNFRLRWVGTPEPLEFRSDDGTAKLAALPGDRAERFRSVLEHGLDQLGAPLEIPVIISGMASSTIGWKELPYATLPFAIDGSNAIWAALNDRVCLVSGLRSATDVMRGEETEILGLYESLGVSAPPHAVAILPGTHSKHVEVRDGAIVGFRTFMTGEVFDLLSKQSVLRHSVDAGSELIPEVFIEGVKASVEQPLLSQIFQVRTRQVLRKLDSASNTSFLSGLLIGSELASFHQGTLPILLAAGDRLRHNYGLAANALGLGDRLISVDSGQLSTLGQGVLLRHFVSPHSTPHA
jgi:2-dehydro-3-deoxygalactonokinase